MYFQPQVVQGIKGFSTKKKKVVSKCVRSRAACCVFFTTASPEEGLKASPSKMFQLILESDLNKIAPLTTATVLAGLVIICLSGVSGAGMSHAFPMFLAEEVRLHLSDSSTCCHLGPGGMCTPRSVGLLDRAQ